MRCLSPRKVSFLADGKTISWNKNKYSPEYAPFTLPCSKCIECRLEYARQWAIRCVHEAKMHPENSFITLTYDDNYLISEKLVYSDFQKFAKRLRKSINQKISIFVTGEYGDERKRPHWHALIFNWRPSDLVYKYSNHRGDKIYSSTILDNLWGKGITELGDVTFESAGYCARYAAKKLIHGDDDKHDFHPISKKSSKNAIGKKFLETYWQDIFNYGQVVLDSGQTASIPRYYEKWLHKHHPLEWENYITQTKRRKCENAQRKSEKEQKILTTTQEKRYQRGNIRHVTTNSESRSVIIKQKFKRLQTHLKGDI